MENKTLIEWLMIFLIINLLLQFKPVYNTKQARINFKVGGVFLIIASKFNEIVTVGLVEGIFSIECSLFKFSI